MQCFTHNFWILCRNNQACNKKITKSKPKGREKNQKQKYHSKTAKNKDKAENYKGSQKIKETRKKGVLASKKDSPKKQ